MTDEEIKQQAIKGALPKPEYFVGVDLGQSRDYTAVIVVQRSYIPIGDLYYKESRREESWVNVRALYDVRHIERFRLGMAYSTQMKQLCQLLEKIGGDIYVIADATGCGRGVIEMLHQELYALGVKMNAPDYPIQSLTPGFVQITAGSTVTKSPPLLNVPKKDLITAPLILLQDERLRISEELELCDVLKRELQNFRVKINIATGHDSYEAWREHEHDDLVLALALACWAAEKFSSPYTRVTVPGFVAVDAPLFTYG